MSIINDALKKTQEKLDKQERRYQKDPQGPVNDQRSSHAAQPQVTRPQQPPEPKRTYIPPVQPSKKAAATQTKTKQPRSGGIFMFLTVAGLLFGILWYVLAGIKNKELAATAKKQQAAPQEPVIFASGKVITPTPDKHPLATSNNIRPVLSGIMQMDDKQAAIINGEVYTVGEVVNGRKIVDIRSKEIDLMEDGRLITINVKDR